MGDGPLVAAVRKGEADEVRRMIESGSDPNTLDERGLPLLCLAVEGFDDATATVLMQEGADPDRPLPGGGTPLMRAVDSGSEPLVATLLDGDRGQRLDKDAQNALLDLARHWHETGVVEELRRRTGASGPAVGHRERGQGIHGGCDRVTLGELTVLDGHAAILCFLELMFRIRTPFDDLLARALVYPDPDHPAWLATTGNLGERQDEETWSAATALRHDPDPLRRCFAAAVVRAAALTGVVRWTGPFMGRALEVLLPWARQEQDPLVLAEVLTGAADQGDPRAPDVALPHIGHGSARVRRAVAHALRPAHGAVFGPEAAQALAVLLHDPDRVVRIHACRAVAAAGPIGQALADVLAGLLDDEDLGVRVEAIHALACQDDPRCVEAERLLVPHDPAWPDSWALSLEEVRRYERRTERRGG